MGFVKVLEVSGLLFGAMCAAGVVISAVEDRNNGTAVLALWLTIAQTVGALAVAGNAIFG